MLVFWSGPLYENPSSSDGLRTTLALCTNRTSCWTTSDVGGRNSGSGCQYKAKNTDFSCEVLSMSRKLICIMWFDRLTFYKKNFHSGNHNAKHWTPPLNYEKIHYQLLIVLSIFSGAQSKQEVLHETKDKQKERTSKVPEHIARLCRQNGRATLLGTFHSMQDLPFWTMHRYHEVEETPIWLEIVLTSL